MAKDKQKAIRLFDFLKELSMLRHHTVRNVSDYEESLWVNELPRETGCFFVGWDTKSETDHRDVWIEVRKPEPAQAPEPDASLSDYLKPKELQNPTAKCPGLYLPEPHGKYIAEAENLEDEHWATKFQPYENQVYRWHRYLRDKWIPWSNAQRGNVKAEQLYKDFFYIYQQQESLGEELELVLALGLLTWKTPGQYDVKRHLLTGRARIRFDSEKGTISVGPASANQLFELEQDALDPAHRPSAEVEEQIKAQIQMLEGTQWNSEGLLSILKSWVHSVSSEGSFDSTLDPTGAASSQPIVRLAPAIILRKQNERNLVRFYDEINESIEKQSEIPLGISQLVSIVDDAKALKDTPIDALDKEVYFPLPANREQVEIADRIRGRQGVLVQGPPGTGKSHTIANLICHLLATGNKVLVTSHTCRALQVLKAKLPESMTQLCVQLLGQDLDGLQELEDSVQTITQKSASWTQDKGKAAITELAKQLGSLREEEQNVFAELHQLRKREKVPFEKRFGQYGGTLLDIARQLQSRAQYNNWFSDQVDEGSEPPMTDAQALDLLKFLRWSTPQKLRELKMKTIDPDSVPESTVFNALVDKENEASQNSEATARAKSEALYLSIRPVKKAQREVLRGLLDRAINRFDHLTHRQESWAAKGAEQVLLGKDKVWRELLELSQLNIDEIRRCDRSVFEKAVTGLGSRKLSEIFEDAKEITKHFDKGGRLGFWIFRSKAVKRGLYIVKQVKIDGQPCYEKNNLKDLVQWLEVRSCLRRLQLAWKPFFVASDGGTSFKVAQYEDAMEALGLIVALHKDLVELALAARLIAPLRNWRWNSLEDLEKLQAVCAALKAEDILANRSQVLDEVFAQVVKEGERVDSHPINRAIALAIQKRDKNAYRDQLSELKQVLSYRNEANEKQSWIDALFKCAPQVANLIESNPRQPEWDDRLRNFTHTWNWARMNTWFEETTNPEQIRRLYLKLRTVQRGIYETLESLAAEKAWDACFKRLSEEQRQHLIAWEKAIKRLGKGTGKHAGTHRQDARNHMAECRSAIPAWIMPMYKVIENFVPGQDKFDVVIVDEASQSGVDALFIFALAKKVIIVGDDKQIAPEMIGITREQVDKLRTRYLADVACNDAIGVDNSLFDFAEIRFGGRIRLREHFRCMPEIIQYSNQLCYQNEPLVPLREYGENRLSPAVQPMYVDNGKVTMGDSSAVNMPECEAIVAHIKKCLKDKNYEDKTIGVISLLGSSQAKKIEQLLINEVGPEQIRKRKIVCGDAYAFQGDERDVIFLSMVSAPSEGKRIGVLSNAKAERRFNVAVSRARDQIFLYHSVRQNELSAKCLRFNLLNYFTNPKVPSIGGEKLDPNEIRSLAAGPRGAIMPPRPFRSWLEVDVYLKIAEKGYRVVPQFPVSHYQIDLVIQGTKARIAVECDDVDTPDSDLQDEILRQRDLERVGWPFWRITASAFYRDPERALESLWEVLDKMDIFPVAKNKDKQAA